MIEVGFTLSCEDHEANELVRQAAAAEAAGLTTATISDHFHPWVGEQGNSPFVWAVLGGVAAVTDELEVGTGVTCPTMRTHPAIVAHAAATAASMLPGRFFLGVGSGENLNEHVLGQRWPAASVRLEMLEEAVELIRWLWQGEEVSHRGRYYTVENARLYSLPEQTPPVYVSAFGPKALGLAARIGDGYVGTSPDPELVSSFLDQAGGGKRTIATAKCCWAPDKNEARRLVHRRWPNLGLPGELAQELPTPAHFEQAAAVVTEEMVADPVPCGPEPQDYVASIRQFDEAGYDVVCLHNVGPHQDAFLAFLRDEVLPGLEAAGKSGSETG